MSTRAQVRFATREDGVSFSEHPEKIHAQFYVHSDGYPEGLGLDIAMSYADQEIVSGWEIEHVDTIHGDIEYIYYIWQDHGKEMWISIFKTNVWGNKDEKCVFVGKPNKLITKYGSQLEDSYYKIEN